MKIAVLLAAAAFVSPGFAFAQSCEQNLVMEGTPMLTKLSFKTSAELPKANPAAALDNLARAAAAEGFSAIRVDKGLGAIDAVQETSGSGRPQTLRMVVRKRGAGARIDAIFTVQAGQVASDAAVAKVLCGMIRDARG